MLGTEFELFLCVSMQKSVSYLGNTEAEPPVGVVSLKSEINAVTSSMMLAQFQLTRANDGWRVLSEEPSRGLFSKIQELRHGTALPPSC